MDIETMPPTFEPRRRGGARPLIDARPIVEALEANEGIWIRVPDLTGGEAKSAKRQLTKLGYEVSVELDADVSEGDNSILYARKP